MVSILKTPALLMSIIFLILLGVLASFPEWITPHDYSEQSAGNLLQTSSAQYLLGTDELGRDFLSRLLFGARVSLGCAFLATLFSGVVGVLYGGISGFVGGKVDKFLMRILDVLYSIPDLLFYILLGLFLGRGFWGMFIALSIFGWVSIARVIRGEVLRIKDSSFIEASYAMGVGPWRIFFYYILPQIKRLLFVLLLFKVPSVILAESTLSFIGLGLKPPHPSWGSMASEGFQVIRFHPHLIFYPSLFIFLTIASFYIVGQLLQKSQK